jgi:hypothetical protein
MKKKSIPKTYYKCPQCNYYAVNTWNYVDEFHCPFHKVKLVYVGEK